MSSVDFVHWFNIDILRCFNSRFIAGTFLKIPEDRWGDKIGQDSKFIEIFAC